MAEDNTSAFGGWLSDVSDTVLDVGGDVAVLWAKNKYEEQPPVQKVAAPAGSATAGSAVVAAGVPTSSNIIVFGVPLNKTALIVGGGALAGAIVLKLIK